MKDKLERIKQINNRLDKAMYFTALLTKELENNGAIPVLVGGGALEFYTQGNYMTLDIDLVVPGRDAIKSVIEMFGFSRSPGEKSWYSEELQLSVEVPDDTLAGSMERIVAVEVEEDLTVYVIGVEDLIIDRLNAYKWWNSLNDGQWAAAVIYIHYDHIDFKYLRNRAGEEGVLDKLEEVVDQTEIIKAHKTNK
ncbi:MAG: DUF6036 family nucleotidyltransferase [Desulfotomaculaceae bacterium]